MGARLERRAVALGLALVALILFATPQATHAAGPVLGGQLFSTGAPVQIEVLPASAALTSTLYLLEPEEIRIATNRDVGTKVTVGPYASGEELVFGIRVSGSEFRMGPGSRNPDGVIHATVDFQADGCAIVGFEDLFGGGDRDYNDNIFRFCGGIAPEPPPPPPPPPPPSTDVPPIANAGADQSVPEGSVVTLDGSASHASGLLAHTYSTTADFANGRAVNLSDATADQLSLDDATEPFDFVWIAASARGTVLKVDARTGKVLGEYASAPQDRAKDPAGATVDKDGDAWVGNRAEQSAVGGVAKGSVAEIGLAENGQCVDRNGNGKIDTSTGLGDVKPWPNASGADDDGGVDTAADECIVRYVRTDGVNISQLSVDAADNVWAGGPSGTGAPSFFDRISPAGAIVRSIDMSSVRCCAGGIVDPSGTLWSSSGDANQLVRIDPSKPNGDADLVKTTALGRFSAGLGIDPGGSIWQANGTSNSVQKVSPTGAVAGTFATGGASNARAVAVTPDGDVWIANSSSNSVSRLRNNGTFVTQTGVGQTPTGVAVDGAGKVWTANEGASTASRINPATNAVDLTVNLGSGAGPDDASDMTGSTLTGAPGEGTWSVVFDSQQAATAWAYLDWTATLPGNSGLTVSVAPSDDNATFGPDVQVQPHAAIAGVAASRYLRVTVHFTRSSGGASPTLLDLSVVHAGGQASALAYKWRLAEQHGPPVFLSSTTSVHPSFVAPDDGTYVFELTVTDASGESNTDRVTVTVDNVAPSLVVRSTHGVAGSLTLVSASHTDAGWLDTHSGTIAWGDGTTSALHVTDGSGWGTAFGSHRYMAAGSYHIAITLTDDDGGTATATTATAAISEGVALWANSSSASSTIDWTGGSQTINGRVHSNRDVKISSSHNRVNGSFEYVNSLTNGGSDNVYTPPPARSTVQPYPVLFTLADYQPGGRAAVAAGTQYYDLTAQCKANKGKVSWTVSGTQLATGLYFAPCDVTLTASSLVGTFTIVSTGTVSVSGSNQTFGQPFIDGLLFFSGSNATDAVKVSGSNSAFSGFIEAPAGQVSLTSSNNKYYCGLLGDRINVSGSNNAVTAGGCAQPQDDTSATLLVPTIGLDLSADRTDALPSQKISYGLSVSNHGSSLIVSGLVGAENVDSASRSVAGFRWALETFDVATKTWQPLATVGPSSSQGATLSVLANPAPGVTYGSSPFVGTALAPGGFASWSYEATAPLDPAAVRKLLDPSVTGGIRVRFDLDFGDPAARVRQLFRFGNDFIAPLRAQSGDITDAKVTLLLPTGDPVLAGSADFPGLARLAPGDSVSLGRTYTVGVPAARGANETDAGYLQRLLVLDRSGLVGSSFALGHGGVGQLVAPLATATTTERLPVVGISTTGPNSIVAGATDSYDLHLSNLGSADAGAIGVSADAAGSPLTVTGAPTTLVPGGLATAKTTYTAPATSPPPDVTVTGAATWSDAAGNTYGPARSAADTDILTPGTLAASLSDSLVDDVAHDGNVSPGDTVRYTLVARNVGGAPLQNASATITPDPNSSLVVGSVAAAGGTVASGNGSGDTSVHVTWTTIAGNSSRQATFDVRVASPFPSSTTHLQVQGQASADGVDPVVTDDPALPGAADPTRTLVVVPAPNLTAFLSGGLAVDADGSGGASAGDTLRYSLVVSSVGALPVTGIDVTVPVPAGTSLVPGSVTTTAGSVRGGGGIGVDAGTLAMLGVATIGFDLKIDDPLAAGITQVVAQGTVSSNELPDLLTDDPDTIPTGDATAIALHGNGSGGGGSAPPGPSVGSVTPTEGAVLTQPSTITATLTPATGTTVTGWTVSYRRSDDTVLTQLAAGTGAAVGASHRSRGAMSTQLAAAAGTDVSATIDPTVLPNGSYVIVIRATSSDGGVTVSETSIVIEGTTKPGRYQTTYEDLNVPVGTIPLQVLRTYDSFDKSNGDFGVGWRLELANFHVTTNGPLGAGGWRMFGCGPGLIFVPLCFDSSKQHYVTVTWPDGHVETFDLTPAKGSTFLSGLTSAQFTARPGATTTSKLEALDSSLYYSNGDLLGGFFGSDGIYDPTQFRLTDRFGMSYILDVTKGLVSATDRNGNTVTVTRDGVFSSLGPSIAFTRDAQGRIKQITDPEGKTIQYGYDPSGDLVKVTDEEGRVAEYAYAGNHDLVSTSVGGGPPLRTLHYGPDGRLDSVTDGAGNTTEIHVDPNTRQQTTTGPDPRLTTVTSYDDRGNPVRIERIFEGQHLVSRFTYNDLALPLTATDPLNHTATAEYDGKGDPTKLVDRDGVETTFTYNASAAPVDYRVDGVLKQHLTYDPAGNVTQVDFAPGLYEQFGYDPQGRLTSTRDLGGRTQSITYDANGFPATVSGPRGTTQLSYDSVGRLRADVDPLGGITQFGVDDSGLVTSVTDPLHHTWAYTYDPTGRLQSEKDPTGKIKSYTYDDAGRLHSVFDRNSVVTTFGYGPAGQVASRVSSDGTSTQYDYDPLGRLTSAENANATVIYTWDPASRPLTESLVGSLASGLPSVTITRGWTDGARLASLSDPNGTTTYGYDPQGRLDSVSDTSAGAFALGYDVLDRLTDLDRQNGADTHWTYTGDRIESQLTRRGTAGPVLDSLAIAYDQRGFPTQITDLTGTSSFTHDALGRLTSETHPAASGVSDESYAYDAAGNRTSWTGNPASAVAYDANDRLLHDARWNYTYDDEGRLITRTDRSTGAATHFGWDAVDDLLHATRPNAAPDVTYRYDPFGRRVETKEGSTVGRTVWAGDNPLLALDGSNQLEGRFVDGLGPDAILASVSGGTSTYPIGDASGTVRADTSAGGAVSATYRYDAFGNPAAGVTPSTPHAFGGLARDPLGMYDARARTYDPATGRFLSEDPLPAVNRYPYAEDSPLLLNDPYGESALVEYGELEEGDAAEEAALLRGTNAPGEVTSRGPFRIGTVRNAWEDAAEGPTGGRLCPTCGDEVNVEPGSGPRDWDVSHNPSWTNREFPPDVTRQEVLDNYQEGTSLECPACNRSGGANDARFSLWGNR